MSFNQLKAADLKRVAEVFGVDLPEKANIPNIIAELVDNGVSYEMWEDHLGRVEESKDIDLPVPAKSVPLDVPEGQQVIVKMIRDNMRYDTFGYTFTKKQPYHVLPVSVAQKIFDIEEGFVMATPREVEEFYS